MTWTLGRPIRSKGVRSEISIWDGDLLYKSKIGWVAPHYSQSDTRKAINGGKSKVWITIYSY